MKPMRFAVMASLIATSVLLSSCGPGQILEPAITPTSPPAATPTSLPTATAPSAPTALQFIGHSCTFITAPDGTRLISDPYGSSHPIELAPFPNGLTADVVTVSHFHRKSRPICLNS
jgi:hypothetical protein